MQFARTSISPSVSSHGGHARTGSAVAVNVASPECATVENEKAVMAKAPQRVRILSRISVSMSAFSLVTLVVQNAMLVLMTRHAKATAKPGEGFYTSTVVLNQEILKLVVCLVALGMERKCRNVSEYVTVVHSVVSQTECFKLALPAGLFTLQNFLIFLSLSNLDVMTFQILSQTKLLSAAVFSVWLLKKGLNNSQWASLVLLTAGVFLAQYETATGSRKTPAPPGHDDDEHMNVLLGGVSCIISGLSSSFAGVYFEKVVKTTPPSLAVRNIHLGLFGIPFALASMLVLDVWGCDDPKGFRYFRGYSHFTFWLIVVHAVGGLLVAAVVKYADNILKGFATAVAIIVSGVFASLLWHYVPSFAFVGGCTMVIVSILVYQFAEEAKKKPHHYHASPPVDSVDLGSGDGGGGHHGRDKFPHHLMPPDCRSVTIENGSPVDSQALPSSGSSSVMISLGPKTLSTQHAHYRGSADGAHSPDDVPTVVRHWLEPSGGPRKSVL
jgi:UDP-sugar transporter A1/2/3